MTTAPVRGGLTWEAFLDLPDDPRYKHAELLDGELVVMDPPSWRHQRVVLRLAAAMDRWTTEGPERGGVTLDLPVRITAVRGYLPDIAWHAEGRARPGPGDDYLASPPDLAVEVLSRTTRGFDLLRKRTDYARVGVRELWLVDPGGPAVMVLRLPDEVREPAEFVLVIELGRDDVLTSPLLPGLEIPLTELG